MNARAILSIPVSRQTTVLPILIHCTGILQSAVKAKAECQPTNRPACQSHGLRNWRRNPAWCTAQSRPRAAYRCPAPLPWHSQRQRWAPCSAIHPVPFRVTGGFAARDAPFPDRSCQQHPVRLQLQGPLGASLPLRPVCARSAWVRTAIWRLAAMIMGLAARVQYVSLATCSAKTVATVFVRFKEHCMDCFFI